jgi:hypothetical protein
MRKGKTESGMINTLYSTAWDKLGRELGFEDFTESMIETSSPLYRETGQKVERADNLLYTSVVEYLL